MFFQHFNECIFHFNSYEKHEKYNRFPQWERSVLQGVLGGWLRYSAVVRWSNSALEKSGYFR